LKQIRRVIICENCECGRYAWEKVTFNLGNNVLRQRKNPSSFGTVRIARIPDLEKADITIIREVNTCTSPDHMTFRVTALYPYY
jgi:hypothetical protein